MNARRFCCSCYVVVQDIEVAQAYQAVSIARSNHVTLRRLDVHDTIDSAVNVASVSCSSDCSDHISIQDSTIGEVAGDPIWLDGARDVEILGNDLGPVKNEVLNCCFAPGDQNIIGVRHSTDVTIAHNRLHGTPQEVSGNQWSAIDVAEQGVTMGKLSVHHNLIQDTTGPGTFVGTNLDIHHNIFVANASPLPDVRDSSNGISATGHAGGLVNVYNNVLYGVSGDSAGLRVSVGIDGKANVMNNIVQAVNPVTGFDYINYGTADRTYSRNNVFFVTQSSNPNPPRFVIGTPLSTLAAAQAAGQEANSRVMDPGFAVTPPTSAQDLMLAASSSLLDTGVDPKVTSAIPAWAPSPSFAMSDGAPSFDSPWGKEGNGFDVGAFEASGSAVSSLATGLVLSEHFDESTLVEAQPTLIDASGSNYHGKPYGGVTPVSGRLDGAVELDGIDDRIEYGKLGSWNPTTFTVSFWMKNLGAGPGGIPRIMSRKFTIDYYTTNNRLNFEIGTTSQNSIAKTTSLTTGVWHHVVCTYDDTNASDRRARVWVDGVLNVTGNEAVGTMVNQGSQMLLVGKHASQPNFFKGQLDELNVWNRVLTDPEIQTLYGVTSVPATPTLAILGAASPNFLQLPTAGYGTVQGATADVPASGKGAALGLSGSGWRRVLFNYTVTANTHLAFLFRSTAQGEIHGIGLDNDDTADPTHTFQLYGSSTYGQTDYADYAGRAGQGWQAYDIPIGQKFTGAMSRIFFANQGTGAASEFSGIYLYEQ